MLDPESASNTYASLSDSHADKRGVLLLLATLMFILSVRMGPASSLLVLFAFVLLVLTVFSGRQQSRSHWHIDSIERWHKRLVIGAIALGLMGAAGWAPSFFGPTTTAMERTPGLAWMALAVFAFVTRHRSSNSLRLVVLLATIALTLAAGLAHLRAVDGIGIDVYLLHTAAADALQAGQNPYTDAVTVPDGSPNAEEGDVLVGYVYPPITAVAYSVGEWLMSDPRYVSLFAWVGFLALTGASAYRRESTAGLLATILMASTPGWLLVLRAGWTEPFTLLLLAGAYTAWRSQKTSGLLAGLGIASKQYFAVTAPLLLLHRDLGWKSRVATIALVPIVTLGAAFVWDPAAFWSAAVEFHLTTTPRPDSANLTGLLSFAGVTWSAPGVMALVVGLVTAALAGRWSRTRRSFFLVMTMSLAGSFLVGSQAFANYWFLIAGLCGLLLIDFVSDPSHPSISPPPQPRATPV